MSSSTMQRDDIYLIDLWRIVRREWRWFAAVFAAVLLVTFAFMQVARPQWQATAWIQIGQVGEAPTGWDPKIEPLQRVLERLQLVPFQNQVLQSIGIAPDTHEAGLYRKSIKVDPLAYAGPLIKVSVRGYSAEQADKFAAATVAQLQAIHRDLQAVPLKLARARLDEVQSSLQTAIAERDRLQQAAVQNKDNLAAVLLTSKNDEISKLQETQNDLAMRLSSQFTFDTSLMWPVYTPKWPVFPNPALTWGMGIVFGLFLGMCAAIARNARRRSALGKVTVMTKAAA
jgi:hypothetical protein